MCHYGVFSCSLLRSEWGKQEFRQFRRRKYAAGQQFRTGGAVRRIIRYGFFGIVLGTG